MYAPVPPHGPLRELARTFVERMLSVCSPL
jgi:hypothetical protein